MGLWNLLFGKRVAISGKSDGGEAWVARVTEQTLEKWESTGKGQRLQMVDVYVLDPMGNYTTQWEIGNQVPEDVVRQSRDPSTGAIYALTMYEAGRPRTMVMPKERWLKAKALMGD